MNEKNINELEEVIGIIYNPSDKKNNEISEKITAKAIKKIYINQRTIM